MDLELEVWDEKAAIAKKELLKERAKQTHMAATELMKLQDKGFNIYSDELLKFLRPYWEACHYSESEKEIENLTQFKQRVFKNMTTEVGGEKVRVGHVDPQTKLLVNPEESTDVEALQRCYKSLYRRGCSIFKQKQRYADQLTKLGHGDFIEQVALEFDESETEEENVR